MPSNEPAPVLGTDAQAGPNWAIAPDEAIGDDDVIGMLDELVIGADELGVAEGWLQAASGISRAVPTAATVIEVRMM